MMPSTQMVPRGNQRDAEYKASGGADQIGLAYAHARGYIGELSFTNSVIVAVVDGPIYNLHEDIFTQTINGYSAKDKYSGTGAGNCSEPYCLDTENGRATHLAGIIVGKNNGLGGLGIAHGAVIRPI